MKNIYIMKVKIKAKLYTFREIQFFVQTKNKIKLNQSGLYNFIFGYKICGGFVSVMSAIEVTNQLIIFLMQKNLAKIKFFIN